MNKCKCGKGYSSAKDDLCRFCREKKLSRSEAKKAGVKHRGDGISFDDYCRHMVGKL